MANKMLLQLLRKRADESTKTSGRGHVGGKYGLARKMYVGGAETAGDRSKAASALKKEWNATHPDTQQINMKTAHKKLMALKKNKPDVYQNVEHQTYDMGQPQEFTVKTKKPKRTRADISATAKIKKNLISDLYNIKNKNPICKNTKKLLKKTDYDGLIMQKLLFDETNEKLAKYDALIDLLEAHGIKY